MGAVFAGAARAPITAVIILFELTGEYSIILPMMTAIVAATLISRRLSADTIYSLKLRRRGIDLDTRPADPHLTATVASMMEPVPEILPHGLDLKQAATRLALSGHGALPVTDDDGLYQGVVTARSVAEALGDDQTPQAVGDLAELPTPVTAEMTVSDALHLLVGSPGTGLPVLAADRTALIGWITHQTVLASVRTPGPRTATLP